MEFNHYKQLHPRDLKLGHVVKLGDYCWSTGIITHIKQQLGTKYWYITVVRPHLDANEYASKDNWYTRFEIVNMVESDEVNSGRWLWVSKDSIAHPGVQ